MLGRRNIHPEVQKIWGVNVAPLNGPLKGTKKHPKICGYQVIQFVTFSSLTWRSLNHPKKVTKNCQVHSFFGGIFSGFFGYMVVSGTGCHCFSSFFLAVEVSLTSLKLRCRGHHQCPGR